MYVCPSLTATPMTQVRQAARRRCCSACPAHPAEGGKVAGTRQGKTLRQKQSVCTQACKGWHSPFPTTSSLCLPLAFGLRGSRDPPYSPRLRILICFSHFCICLHQGSSFSAEDLCHSFTKVCSAQVTLGQPETAPFQARRKARRHSYPKERSLVHQRRTGKNYLSPQQGQILIFD